MPTSDSGSPRARLLRRPRALTALGLAVSCSLVPSLAPAQQAGAAAPAGGAAPAQAAQPAAPTYGAPPAQGSSDRYLPSSSRTTSDTSRSSDGFDLVPKGTGTGTVRGSADSAGVIEPHYSRVPATHTV